MQALVGDLNRLYAAWPALHASDAVPEGFRWLVQDDRENSVYAYLREVPGEKPVVTVVNLTPIPRWNYRIGIPRAGGWREVFNSDATSFGGSGIGNGGWAEARAERLGDEPAFIEIVLPPLGALVFVPEGDA
jgi:1,4-alpha-glucan branching enzyme